jgi:hypothetical protein
MPRKEKLDRVWQRDSLAWPTADFPNWHLPRAGFSPIMALPASPPLTVRPRTNQSALPVLRPRARDSVRRKWKRNIVAAHFPQSDIYNIR